MSYRPVNREDLLKAYIYFVAVTVFVTIMYHTCKLTIKTIYLIYHIYIMLPGQPGDIWDGIKFISNADTGTGNICYYTSSIVYLSSPST